MLLELALVGFDRLCAEEGLLVRVLLLCVMLSQHPHNVLHLANLFFWFFNADVYGLTQTL